MFFFDATKCRCISPLFVSSNWFLFIDNKSEFITCVFFHQSNSIVPLIWKINVKQPKSVLCFLFLNEILANKFVVIDLLI